MKKIIETITKSTTRYYIGCILAGIGIGLAVIILLTGCGLFTANLPGMAEDLLSGGYKSVHCDPTKLIQPQRAGCDPDDQIAVECTATTKTGETVVVLVCSEIQIEREGD
jgi:hypothetical protein